MGRLRSVIYVPSLLPSLLNEGAGDEGWEDRLSDRVNMSVCGPRSGSANRCKVFRDRGVELGEGSEGMFTAPKWRAQVTVCDLRWSFLAC